MAGGRFSKQGSWNMANVNANNANDTAIGGAISGLPSGANASQGFQNLPGDRTIFSVSDAIAYNNNNVGNLYTGTYRYVAMRNNSTANPTRGRAAFWDLAANGSGANISTQASDKLYQITADGNTANITNLALAGFFINNITLNNGTGAYWWIQESGKCSCKFRGTITAPTPAIGNGVYLLATAAANNNSNDNGAVDQLVGTNSTTIFQANSTTAYTTIDQMITDFVGIAETLPSNNNISLVDVCFWRGGWRW